MSQCCWIKTVDNQMPDKSEGLYAIRERGNRACDTNIEGIMPSKAIRGTDLFKRASSLTRLSMALFRQCWDAHEIFVQNRSSNTFCIRFEQGDRKQATRMQSNDIYGVVHIMVRF